MRLHSLIIPPTLAVFSSACVVEQIDALLAERGVTYAATMDSSTGTSTSTSTGPDTDTSTDTGEASSTGGGSDSLSAGETSAGSTDASSSTGEPTQPICGDGVVDGDEECDDANPLDGDSCRNDCLHRWTIFVTSEPFKQGNFNGVTGADYECRHRATKMFLPHGERYMAWVSTSTVQPADRMYHARGPYVLVNGLQVAANWDALTSGTLEHAIDVSEQSLTVSVLPRQAWWGFCGTVTVQKKALCSRRAFEGRDHGEVVVLAAPTTGPTPRRVTRPERCGAWTSAVIRGSGR